MRQPVPSLFQSVDLFARAFSVDGSWRSGPAAGVIADFKVRKTSRSDDLSSEKSAVGTASVYVHIYGCVQSVSDFQPWRRARHRVTDRYWSKLSATSDATIYRPNDISSRYWPYRIVSISSRKISKFRYIVIVSIAFQYRWNDVDVVYL